MIETLRKKFERLAGVLDERGRRVWATVEAEALGYGGQSIVAKATGLSRTTLYHEGLEKAQDPTANHRVRIQGNQKTAEGSRRLSENTNEKLSSPNSFLSNFHGTTVNCPTIAYYI